ncbi:3-oxoacyl-[acyl-carrier-protein] reductase FabG [Candidatus Rubidus massiliensis]|nr:3-oxoacyl-[acyl-carrier-protein] reductase FabG [Candidatus Rubidus massiliensis]
MKDLLKDQVAIVTGGTAGIGTEIVKTFVENGAKVIFTGTNVENGEKICKEIQPVYGSESVHFYPCNIADFTQVQHLFKNILEKFHKVDILVNNAGITKDKLLMKMTEEDWDSVLAVNLKSCYNTCHAIVRPMMKARKGSIINISSVVGINGNPGQLNYASSKAAMIGFSKSLAKELGPRQIRVNCVAPGYIETKMTDQLKSEQKLEISSKIALGRIGNPQEVANAVLFLASPLSEYITGHVLVVDGGM